MATYLPHDVVQIVDESDAWYPCLVLVTEVKAWGVQGCVLIPESNDPNTRSIGQAYRRIGFDKIERVGAASVGIGVEA